MCSQFNIATLCFFFWKKFSESFLLKIPYLISKEENNANGS